MKLYFDSSALIKRVCVEDFSDAVEAYLAAAVRDGHQVGTAWLTWIEVERALRARRARGALPRSYVLDLAVEAATSGVDQIMASGAAMRMARWIGSDDLRALDAIQLATAVLDDCDVMVTYDDRLAAASTDVALKVVAPGMPV